MGDALVSQIPALMISTPQACRRALRPATTGSRPQKRCRSRRAVAATAGMLTLFALLPGMPAFPFLALAGALGLAVRAGNKKEEAELKAAAIVAKEPAKKPGSSEEIDAALPLDIFALEVGYELVQAVDPSRAAIVARTPRCKHIVARMGS